MNLSMNLYLETERLILRRFTKDDADLLVDLDSDPEVMRYITGGSATPRETIEDEILPAFLAYYERGDRYGFWAAIEKTTGSFIGWFHLRPPYGSSDPDAPELGYRLRRQFWGQGYATEGSKALIHKGFTELGISRVTAVAYKENLASLRVLEKCGLRFVRMMEFTPEQLRAEGLDPEDYWEGDMEFALDRADWEGRQ